MRFYIRDFSHSESASGDEYEVLIWFMLEGGETKSKLNSANLKIQELDAGDKTKNGSHGANSIIPQGSTAFGPIGGVTLDNADSGSVLKNVSYGNISTEIIQNAERCYRPVTLKYEPVNPSALTARPGVSTSDDPDNWYPEYSKSNLSTVRHDLPLEFIGMASQSDISLQPIIDRGASIFKATPYGPTQGGLSLFMNSAGELLQNSPGVEMHYQEHRFIEYFKTYTHTTAQSRLLTQINDRDLLVKVQVAGSDFVTLNWDKGVAAYGGNTVRSAVFKPQGAPAIPYVIRETVVYTNPIGWDILALNVGYREVIDDNGTKKNQDIRTDRGKLRAPVFLSQTATTLPPDGDKTYMIWGLPYVDFATLFGATANSPTITIS